MMLHFFIAIAVLATYIGGRIPLERYISRGGMRNVFALRAGILLSIAFTEVFPAAVRNGSLWAGWGALAAFVMLFVAGQFAMVDSCPEYIEECDVHILSWAALAALFVHSLLDGFNFAVSFAAGAVAGSAVGVALTLHKVADGFTLTSLFRQSGYSEAQSLLGLTMVALATPLGAALSHFGIMTLGRGPHSLLLGFAGGSFIYIGASDILPSLHHKTDRSSLIYFGGALAAIACLELF